MKSLILGIGNPILCDDAVGIIATRELQKCIKPDEDISFEETSVAGVNLLDIMSGYDHVVIIDAIQTGSPIGKIHTYNISESNTQIKKECYHHNLTLFQTIELGKKMTIPMPSSILIFAIEAKDVISFTQDFTPELEAKFPSVVENILKELKTRGLTK